MLINLEQNMISYNISYLIFHFEVGTWNEPFRQCGNSFTLEIHISIYLQI